MFRDLYINKLVETKNNMYQLLKLAVPLFIKAFTHVFHIKSKSK